MKAILIPGGCTVDVDARTLAIEVPVLDPVGGFGAKVYRLSSVLRRDDLGEIAEAIFSSSRSGMLRA